MDHPARHVDGVSGPYRVTRHNRVVVLCFERLVELVAAQALLDPGQDSRAFSGPEDVPGLGLAVWLAMFSAGRLVVGVEMDGEHVRGVDELLQKREVRAAPAFADQLIRELGNQLMELSARVGSV